MLNPNPSEHIILDGQLYIDTTAGVLTFIDTDSRRILRVTHLPTPVPDNIGIDLVAIRNVTSYYPLQLAADIEEAPEPETYPPCDICHKVHADIEEVVMIGRHGLYPEHEYLIETKTPQQKYIRRWRMGYVGKGLDRYHLVFSARGPDRTHNDQYAGDVTLDIREVLGILQMPKDVAARHTAREVRAEGRVT